MFERHIGSFFKEVKGARALIVLLFCVVMLGILYSAEAQSLSPQEALQESISDLQVNPNDNALRQKIIKLSQEIKPEPAIPAEAEKFGNRAEYVIKNAKTDADFADAAKEYEKALLIAPWVSAYYFNLGVASEKTGQLQDAVRSYKFYLMAAPNAQDTQEVRKQIDGMEYVLEKAISWAVDPSTGCRIAWNSSDYTLRAASWSGPMADGKAEGRGTLRVTVQSRNGHDIQGSGEVEMVAGLLDGRGAINWSDNHSYDGYFKDGMRNGKGIMKFSDDHVYDGTWKNDRQLVGQMNVDKVLGIPWGAPEKEAKLIMLQHPNTKFYTRKKERNGTITQTYMTPYHNDSREIWVHFYEGKMFGVSIVFVVNGDQFLEQFNPLKEILLQTYGPPGSMADKGFDSFAKWTLGGGNFLKLRIWNSQFPPQNPFRVLMQYANSQVADIVNGGSAKSSGKND